VLPSGANGAVGDGEFGTKINTDWMERKMYGIPKGKLCTDKKKNNNNAQHQ
jgi:hypothetical protein